MKKGIKTPIKDNKKEISRDTIILFFFSISHLQYKDKIRFYYALKGRDGKSGILNQPKITQVAKSVILVPLELDKEFQEFFQHWNCKFKRIKVRLEDE